MRREHSQVHRRPGSINNPSTQRVHRFEGSFTIASLAIDRYQYSTGERDVASLPGDDRKVGRTRQELRVVPGEVRQYDKASEQEENENTVSVNFKENFLDYFFVTKFRYSRKGIHRHNGLLVSFERESIHAPIGAQRTRARHSLTSTTLEIDKRMGPVSSRLAFQATRRD
jgi:hypothetical protein